MNKLVKDFKLSLLVALVGLVAGFFWGGIAGMLTVGLLSVLEVSFSVDNAVVNAKTLKYMNSFWRFIFMTVGIAVAVVGMRLMFPVTIVSVITGLGMAEVADMALHDTVRYGQILQSVDAEVGAFGGVFLLLVSMDFVLQEGRESHWFSYALNNNGNLKRVAHFESVVSGVAGACAGRVLTDFLFNRNGHVSWIGWTEEKLTTLGDKMGVAIAAGALMFFSMGVAEEERGSVLISGLSGLVLFMVIKTLAGTFESDDEEGEDQGDGLAKAAASTLTRNGIMGFLYLEVMDASFSFDGVIGAFALTNDIVIIMIGLAVGAWFVRSLTVYLVKEGTLDEYEYLEHGAMYAIGALAFLMLFGMTHHVPEIVSGLAGAVFIGASVMSSISKKQEEADESAE